MKSRFSLYQLLLLVIYFKYVKLVPDDYCLPPLNSSDCGIPPTPVFSYYKYGSRCEIEFWRGCPTENMFENEYHCSHYCIGRTRFYGRERGSWKGRDRTSIDGLSLSELEDINGILHNINDSVTDATLKRLINRSPRPRPTAWDSKTTVEDAKKDCSDKTTEDNAENTEYNESDDDDDDDDDDYVTNEPIHATQMPLKHAFTSHGDIPNINDSVTDAALERLINRSPRPRPTVQDSKTTVEDAEKDYSDKTTEDNAENTEDNESDDDDDDDDDDYVTNEPILATQMPLKHAFTSHGDIHRRSGVLK